MKISTKGRYGVRFLMDLGAHAHEGSVTLKDVARRQAISEKYLWQVVNPLKAAGFIRATLGAHGGYKLAKSPATISLLDILAVLEGQGAVVACVSSPGTCCRSNDCTARQIWREVDQKVSAVLKAITLHDMIERHQATVAVPVLDYCI